MLQGLRPLLDKDSNGPLLSTSVEVGVKVEHVTSYAGIDRALRALTRMCSAQWRVLPFV